MKNIKVPVIDKQGNIVREETLPRDIFSVEFSPLLLAQAVRVFLSNQRKASAKTKTRSEVDKSSAKIWRQKGTGHARHGDRKAPIFVGGGVAHGPTGEQNYELKLSQKQRQKAILSILSQKAQENKLFILENLDFNKTKQAQEFINKLTNNLKLKGKIGFLLGGDDSQLQKTLRNLKNTSVLKTSSLNSYYLLKQDTLFFTKNGLEELAKIYKFRGKNEVN